jgi:hypothetical protein
MGKRWRNKRYTPPQHQFTDEEITDSIGQLVEEGYLEINPETGMYRRSAKGIAQGKHLPREH